MLKKNFAVLLIVLLIFINSALSIISYCECGAIDVTTTISDTNVQNTFTVDFLFANVTSIMGYKITLRFDKNILNPISASSEGDFVAGNFADNIGVADNEFNILWNDIEPHSAGGKACSVVFERLANVSTEIYLSYSQEDTFDQNWDDVQLKMNNIKVSAATCLVSA